MGSLLRALTGEWALCGNCVKSGAPIVALAEIGGYILFGADIRRVLFELLQVNLFAVGYKIWELTFFSVQTPLRGSWIRH